MVCYWSAKVVVLCLLVCLAGFEPKDTISLAFASELDDEQGAPVDVQLVSSITSKAALRTPSKRTKPPMTMNRILIKAGKRGLGGGLPGAIAGVVQVLSLMWVRYVLDTGFVPPPHVTSRHIFGCLMLTKPLVVCILCTSPEPSLTTNPAMVPHFRRLSPLS